MVGKIEGKSFLVCSFVYLFFRIPFQMISLYTEKEVKNCMFSYLRPWVSSEYITME